MSRVRSAWRRMAAIGGMGVLSVGLLAASGNAQTVGADITVTAGGPSAVIIGGQVTQTFGVTNIGTLAAGQVTLQISLPHGNMTHVSSTPSQGTCQFFAGGQVTCNLTPGATTFASGAAAFVKVTLKGVKPGTTVSAAAADVSTPNDPDPANNSAAVLTTVTEQPEAVVGSIRNNARMRQGPNQIRGRVNPSIGVKALTAKLTRGTGSNCRAYVPAQKAFTASCQGNVGTFKPTYLRAKGQWTVGFAGRRLAPGFYTFQIVAQGTNNKTQKVAPGENRIRFTVLPKR